MGDVKFVNIPLSEEQKNLADLLKEKIGGSWPEFFMKLIRDEMNRRGLNG